MKILSHDELRQERERLSQLTDQSWLESIQTKNKLNVIKGCLDFSWWELDENLDPVKLVQVTLNSFPSMSHMMEHHKMFPSVSEARKNGWNRPMEIGEFLLKKKRVLFRIVQ